MASPVEGTLERQRWTVTHSVKFILRYFKVFVVTMAVIIFWLYFIHIFYYVKENFLVMVLFLLTLVTKSCILH